MPRTRCKTEERNKKIKTFCIYRYMYVLNFPLYILYNNQKM